MPQTIAHFQLLELIGRGTLGELHRGRDLQLGRSVAVRLIATPVAGDASSLAEVFDAARLAVAASHPALAAVYEWGEDAGVAYIAGEFVPGQRLSAVVNGSPLNQRRALDLGAQIADGLATAHAHGLSHGALDSDVVMLTPKGTTKVLDVGFARWTRGGLAASDDFAALGGVLFEMLVGRRMKAGWPGELRDPQVPADLRGVLERLTIPHARHRFDSMAAVAGALRAHGDGADAPAIMEVLREPESSHTSFRRIMPVVVFALLMLAAWWLVGR